MMSKRRAASSRKSERFRSGKRSSEELGGPRSPVKPHSTVRRVVWSLEMGALEHVSLPFALAASFYETYRYPRMK